MGTKMKGVLKGLRYITQIFEDEKEPEMQIGFPMDVKHVAHIGWDGPSPSVDNSPTWMKEYKSPKGSQTANEEGKENPDKRWGSQDSLSQKSSGPITNPTRDLSDLPKSSRRNSIADGATSSGSPKGSKSRQSRRNSSESSKSSRKQKDPVPGSESPSRILPGLPKRSSRKKTKESSTGGSTRSRTKAVPSDLGQDTESTPGCDSNTLVDSSSLKSSVKEEDKG